MPGHLSAEGPQGGSAPRDGGAAVRVEAGADDVAGTIARDVPQDPSSSNDVVLRVGYQMLKAQMSAKAPLTK